jgi:hypothetical protein
MDYMGTYELPAYASDSPPRRLGYALVGCGLALLPWLLVLATGLPGTATAPHWSYAWTGLDALEAVGLITTGLPAVRGGHPRAPVAAATATLLVVDAWFDTMTAATYRDLMSALAMAVCAELPLAVLCMVMSVRATRIPRRS